MADKPAELTDEEWDKSRREWDNKTQKKEEDISRVSSYVYIPLCLKHGLQLEYVGLSRIEVQTQLNNRRDVYPGCDCKRLPIMRYEPSEDQS